MYFALPTLAPAISPAPDGGYPNGNTAEGDYALLDLTTGELNTALGFQALKNNTTGIRNTATGSFALSDNTMGRYNTATGDSALSHNQTGWENTAVGESALQLNTASSNTATGAASLATNSTGYSNVANGWYALYRNTVGAYNTAIGSEALYSNTGEFNTAGGSRTLYTNSTGDGNTANGYATMYYNTTGGYNTAEGTGALTNNTSGSNNVAVGSNAGANLTTGNNNIVIGANVLGKTGDANKIRIGKQGTQNGTFIAGIYNIAEPVASGIKPVYVNSNGQLGTTPPASSARFKEAIKPMDKTSEAILGLKPVTFRYKNDEATPQFGLVAEEVAKVNPDLVLRDDEGKIYTVRYEAVNAMLLNEFLKEHRKVEEQESTIDQLKATVAKQQEAFGSKIAQQQKQIETLAAGLQKVSAAVELNKAAPTQVADNR
jgi:hypothetical protein